MKKTLRVGILGTGFIASVHLKSLRQIPGVEVVAVANPVPGAIGSFATDNGIPACYDSFLEMVDSEALDAVYLCIPPFAHNGEAELAASRGIHLFLEKPIAINSAKAAAIVEAAEQAGIVTQTGFHFRFRKSVRMLKQLIVSGEAGQPTLFTGRYWTNMDGADWWRDQSRSGGQIFEQAIHLYDLANYLMGPADVACGLLRNLCHDKRPDYTIEDTSLGALRFSSGAIGVITASNCAIPVHFVGDFKVICQNLTLDYHSTGQHWVTPDQATLYRGAEPPVVIPEDEDPYLLESADFIEAIRQGRPATTPARDGLDAIRLVEAVFANAAR